MAFLMRKYTKNTSKTPQKPPKIRQNPPKLRQNDLKTPQNHLKNGQKPLKTPPKSTHPSTTFTEFPLFLASSSALLPCSSSREISSCGPFLAFLGSFFGVFERFGDG
jgi:hypothetical protein